MLKLIPALKDYVWGGNRLKTLYGREGGDKVAESWEVSVHPDGPSGIAGGGTLAEYLAARPEAAGAAGGLPVLIKYIDAAQNLSVQVHPDDAFARREEGDNGKTEMWYIIGAEEGAGIYCGFRKDTDKDAFLAKVQDGSVQELLNFIPVKAGDCFLIEAGTVHAIGAGCLICEVQQSSNVTYRVYDYGRLVNGKPRQLHLDKAMLVINFSAFRDRTGSGKKEPAGEGCALRHLTQCRYFRCRELTLGGTFAEQNGGSFTAIDFLSGEGEINGEHFRAGDSFFIPCGEKFEIKGKGLAVLTDSPKEETV